MIPRDFFPNMPDEVFNMWLEPISREYGWPFVNATDTINESNKWFYVLCKLNLGFWVNTHWSQIKIDFKTTPLSKGSYFSVTSILQRCVEGLPTMFAGVQRSEERFGACAEFIKIHNRIPAPIIATVENGEVKIIDGAHRIAALMHVGLPENYLVPAWVPMEPTT